MTFRVSRLKPVEVLWRVFDQTLAQARAGLDELEALNAERLISEALAQVRAEGLATKAYNDYKPKKNPRRCKYSAFMQTRRQAWRAGLEVSRCSPHRDGSAVCVEVENGKSNYFGCVLRV